MLHLLVIVHRFSLLKTYAQFRSSGSGTVVFDFFASFLDFKYSRGHFFLFEAVGNHFPEKTMQICF